MRQEPFPAETITDKPAQSVQKIPSFQAINSRYCPPMILLESFLDPATVSLKICGVTSREDAQQLIHLGIDALGFNFWPKSKRYLDPATASWLRELKGQILRVGVFVNEPPELALRLIQGDCLDVIQLHGDESPADAQPFINAKIPFIKAFGVKTQEDFKRASEFGASAILLDAHAPGIYGGTGEVFDWEMASDFRRQQPALPVILAGGITSENAALAAMSVQPAALDIASGAESSPGVKDFKKISAFLTALHR